MSMQLALYYRVDAPVYYCATVNNTERRSTLDDEAHSSFHSRRALSVSSFQGEAQPLITHLIRAIRDYMANVAAYDERRETRGGHHRHLFFCARASQNKCHLCLPICAREHTPQFPALFVIREENGAADTKKMYDRMQFHHGLLRLRLIL
jgi:hypothetical protein